MGVHPGLGVLHVGVVDDGGQHVEDHEDHGRGKAGEQQGEDGQDDEGQVDGEEMGPQQGLLLVGELGHSDFGIAQGHGADAGFLLLAQQGGEYHHAD